MRARSILLACVLLASGCAHTEMAISTAPPPPRLDVIYVPTADEIVRAMLDTAQVGPGDVVYDLGCGDGRIVIAAAALYGARGVGVDLDPARIREAEEAAYRAGVSDRVKFVVQDLFATDVSEATVVALYLSSDINQRLKPRLLGELKPGSRVVSHQFDMGDWRPQRVVDVAVAGAPHRVYLWRIADPARQ